MKHIFVPIEIVLLIHLVAMAACGERGENDEEAPRKQLFPIHHLGQSPLQQHWARFEQVPYLRFWPPSQQALQEGRKNLYRPFQLL